MPPKPPEVCYEGDCQRMAEPGYHFCAEHLKLEPCSIEGCTRDRLLNEKTCWLHFLEEVSNEDTQPVIAVEVLKRDLG